MASETDVFDTGWQAQALRLTLFLSAPLEFGVAATLWQTAVGGDPEIDDNRPRESIRRQAGPFEDWYLETLIAPARVDWVLAPKVDDAQSRAQPYSESFDKAMGAFTTAGRRWLATGSPSINRIAVGAVLLMPVADSRAAHQKLNDLLTAVRVDPDRSLDFFYQINWPRVSTVVSELRLNRLTRWSAIAVRSLSLQVDDNKASVLSGPSGGQDYCRLECDHSTQAGQIEPFAPTDLDEFFRELCEMVEENAKHGEVKGTELI
jgi:hypothetical protein